MRHTADMNVHDFQNKWRSVTLTERSAAQQHFLDLCRLLGQPTPAEADAHGTWYTFEKGVQTTIGGSGFADVWMRGHFAWEYKRNRANLNAAYQQLLQYSEALENPPLLVVSDFYRFEIHTRFTGMAKRVYAFTLDELDQPEKLDVLRALFTSPERLRPETPVTTITEDAAARFGRLAIKLQDRGVEPQRAAHFLVQVLFCLFAEDVRLLPSHIFSKLLAFSARHPEQFAQQIEELFIAMRDGGVVAYEEVVRFNGGLFAEIDVVPLTGDEIQQLAEASKLDWASIEPAIIGTLFERSLDPSRRAQLGAHYTGRADIRRVVEPVVMTPLRRRWEEVQVHAEKRKAAWDKATTQRTRENRRAEFANELFAFQEELAHVRILDPACGSGNFLYVALSALLDVEKEVVAYGSANGLPAMLPRIRPSQLYGLEINEYARELTQAVVWIGYLQWMTANGFQPSRDPVLEPLETIRLQDAILDLTDPMQPREAEWPEADYIIGNPPFLGGGRVRSELGNEYVEDLFRVYGDRLPNFSDLVCYFYEKARQQIEAGRTQRAGLLATNSIRGGANREVLKRIKESGDIYMAWSDEPWILEGAAVRISIVGFDDGTECERRLNGLPVEQIFSDLTATVDITGAQVLAENKGICFMGPSPKGSFDIPFDIAREMLDAPSNPNGRPNSDVVRPVASAVDLVRRSRNMWTIDFGFMPLEEAALYEMPFEHVRHHVYPVRSKNRRRSYAERWWQYAEARPGMREALKGKNRFIATPGVSKHRLYVWMDVSVLCNQGTLVFTHDDDYFFGILHSRAHELWSLRMGTWLGKGNDPRYTPTTCFETFPLPWPPGQEPWGDPRVTAIAEAAMELNELRERWLNPEGASESDLKKLTLTNLYNARPTWLENAHYKLDRAVWAAYGWDDSDPATDEDEAILARLLALNLERAERNDS